MAASSVTANIVLDKPAQAERFARALDESEKDSIRAQGKPEINVVRDKDEIRRIIRGPRK